MKSVKTRFFENTKTKRTEYRGIEYWTCCFCEEIFTGIGNNPDTHREDDECCDNCNNSIVIPMRMDALSLSFNRETA